MKRRKRHSWRSSIAGTGGVEPPQSKVSQFEDRFASYCQAKHGIAVTNGTQALECALKAAGIEAGDEVIVPALTFVATATSVALVNAVPIIPVHNGGYPCDMDAISQIARKHKLVVIEDCAHAHGSEWKGRRCGSLGDLSAFSFQQFKVITCGEGGIVLTSDEELAEKAYSFMHIGRMPDRPFLEI